MSDIIDQANDRAALDLQIALSAALKTSKPLPSIGRCYNCDEPVQGDAHFCDCDCRNDYATRKRAESFGRKIDA